MKIIWLRKKRKRENENLKIENKNVILYFIENISRYDNFGFRFVWVRSGTLY